MMTTRALYELLDVSASRFPANVAVEEAETGSIRYSLIMAGYMFALAYAASFITFRVARALLGG